MTNSKSICNSTLPCEFSAYVLTFVCLHFALSATEVLNSFQELCITRNAITNSSPKYSTIVRIHCHPQTKCFIASLIFCGARHARCLKLGSKPGRLYVSRISHIYIYVYIHIYIYVCVCVCLSVCVCGLKSSKVSPRKKRREWVFLLWHHTTTYKTRKNNSEFCFYICAGNLLRNKNLKGVLQI